MGVFENLGKHMKEGRVHFRAVTLFVLMAVLVPGLAGRSPAQDQFSPLIVSLVGSTVTPVKGSDGRFHVVYELLLTNARRIAATLEGIAVVAEKDGAAVFRFDQNELIGLLRNLDTTRVWDTVLAPNQSRLLLVSLTFDSERDVPAGITHRIDALGAAGPGAQQPSRVTFTAGSFRLSRHGPPVFAPPLRGEGWIVANGCCAAAGVHRGAVQSVNGQLFDSQRFAIDWLQMDAAGRLVSGDAAEVKNWVGYGAKIYAAAGGTVIASRGDLQNQLPGALPNPDSLTLETVLGNFAVIGHGGGVFTFYAHMQPGSVRVKTGDHVKTGDEIGLLGNTGNTSAPHLHFHVMAGPSALGSDGIPFVFDAFSSAGRIDDDAFEKALNGASLPRRVKLEKHQDELPLDNTIVNFPPAD